MPRIGLSNLHYAKLISDGPDGATYDTPKKITKLARASVNPQTNSATYYADNGPAETYSAMGDVEIELEVGDIPIEVQAELLGATVKNGVMYNSADDQPPYIAIGFEGLKSNGKRMFYWLYKGKFSVPAEELQTLQDAPEYQPETLTGVFVKREYDGRWRAKADEDAEGFDPAIATNWYNEVHEEPTGV